MWIYGHFLLNGNFSFFSYGIVIIITAKTGHRAIISAGKCLGSLSGVAHSLIRIQAGYRWESRKV